MAFIFLAISIVLLILGYNLARVRMILMSVGFFALITGAFATYSNWLPQVEGTVPEEVKLTGDVESMSPDKLAELGATIVWQDPGKQEGGGKGQCPLCHQVKSGQVADRAPTLLGIATTAAQRIKDPGYHGKATTAEEYIAESHSCPNCFVVPGFGIKGTNDKESPMPVIHKAPISLSIDEQIALDTFLFVKDGEAPPSPKEIRAAYEKFIPESERPTAGPAPTAPAPAGPPIVLASDTPEQIVTKMACFACHQIPTIAAAKFGPVGPLLLEKINAPKRMASPEYQSALKAGKAHARTPREYVIESIMNPNAFVVPAFRSPVNPAESPMPKDFSQKFTFAGVEKLADFLLSLDCNTARTDGLRGPPQEPIDKVCGAGGSQTAAAAP